MAVKRSGIRCFLAFRISGVTLLETLIAAVLLGIVTGFSYKIIMSYKTQYCLNKVGFETQRDGRNAMQLMTKRLRKADRFSVVISREDGQPPCSKISFVQYASSGKTKPVSFYQQGSALYQVDGSARRVCKDVRYLSFHYPRTEHDGLLSVSLALERDTLPRHAKKQYLVTNKVRMSFHELNEKKQVN